ncbi:MAG TPA: lipoprotein [Pseudorhodoplanes sp.]|nr:lipoprotein [Pseudorhodoplanes sp.]
MIFPTRALYRVALAAALAGALALAACGRKGPLDAPPGAAITPAAAPEAAPQEDRTLFGDATNRDPGSQPVAPKGQKKRIPLDVLLD